MQLNLIRPAKSSAKPPRFLGRQEGFTFVEVMVGVAIISIASLAVYYMFIMGSELMYEQLHRRIAFEKAVSRLEEIKYLVDKNHEIPRHLAGAFSDIISANGSGEFDDLVAQVSVSITESEVKNPLPDPSEPDFMEPAFYEVSIVYDWEEESGREYDVKINTRID
jgi:prepilin-type N-terminal cleavage/methylation domain-containing protein